MRFPYLTLATNIVDKLVLFLKRKKNTKTAEIILFDNVTKKCSSQTTVCMHRKKARTERKEKSRLNEHGVKYNVNSMIHSNCNSHSAGTEIPNNLTRKFRSNENKRPALKFIEVRAFFEIKWCHFVTFITCFPVNERIFRRCYEFCYSIRLCIVYCCLSIYTLFCSGPFYCLSWVCVREHMWFTNVISNSWNCRRKAINA